MNSIKTKAFGVPEALYIVNHPYTDTGVVCRIRIWETIIYCFLLDFIQGGVIFKFTGVVGLNGIIIDSTTRLEEE